MDDHKKRAQKARIVEMLMRHADSILWSVDEGTAETILAFDELIEELSAERKRMEDEYRVAWQMRRPSLPPPLAAQPSRLPLPPRLPKEVRKKGMNGSGLTRPTNLLRDGNGKR